MEAGIVSYGAYVPRYRITPDRDRAGLGRRTGRAWARGSTSAERASPPRTRTRSPSRPRRSARRSFEARSTRRQIGALYVGSRIPPVRRQADGDGRRPGGRSDPEPHGGRLRVRLQGRHGGHPDLPRAGRGRHDPLRRRDRDRTPPRGRPGDALEYSASAGGAAFVIGRERVIAASIARSPTRPTRRTSGAARASGIPSHGGRFTGRARLLPARDRMRPADDGACRDARPKDYAHVVFHQPNGKFPQRVGKQLGFTDAQMKLRTRHAVHREHLLRRRPDRSRERPRPRDGRGNGS